MKRKLVSYGIFYFNKVCSYKILTCIPSQGTSSLASRLTTVSLGTCKPLFFCAMRIQFEIKFSTVIHNVTFEMRSESIYVYAHLTLKPQIFLKNEIHFA